VNPGVPEGSTVPVNLVTHVLLLLDDNNII
jgi:hypothetical protein